MKILSLLSGLALTIAAVLNLSAQNASINRVATFSANQKNATEAWSSGYLNPLLTNTESITGYNRSVWSSSFGGELRDECYSAIQTSDGGYALIGRSNSYGAGDFDGWLIKTDASGNKLWEKTFGDTYIDEAYVIKETTDGGFIIGGMSTAFGWSGEGWLIKTDNAGEIIWNNGYHPTDGPVMAGWEYIYDIIPTDDGGYIFGGVAAPVVGSMQAWVGKVDADGELLWDHCYGLEYWERIFGLAPTSDGGFVAVGDRHWTYDNMMWQHDGWLLKFDSNGDTTWTQHFGEIEHDIFRSVKQTDDGGYIICGESEHGVQMGFNGWMVRTDDLGNPIWNNHLSKGGLYSVHITGNSFTTAGVFMDPYLAGEGWLINTDFDGNINWESLIDGSNTDDIFLSLNPTSDGGLIAGGKYAQSADICDYWLVSIDADGPEALTYFYEDFDEVTQPELPQNWVPLVDVMLANTVAEVRTMENGITTSAPNAVFIMNGLNGSNGQPDTSAFVALVTPYVKILNDGASLTLKAAGNNSIQIGTLTDPADINTWTLISELPLISDFTEFYIPIYVTGEYYLAIKHSNQTQVTPVFVDDIEFKQNSVDVTDKVLPVTSIYPNPAHNKFTITSSEDLKSISIFNLTGSEVFTRKVSGNNVTLERENVKSGIYFIKATFTSGKSAAYKIIFF